MLVSVSWLKKYVQIPVDTKELVEDLTMVGLNVEHLEVRGLNIENLVVGKVLEAERHPNADRLTACRVQVGPGEEDIRSIVCGAPNVAAGQLVPVVLPGAKLPGGMKIKKSKIRGVTSEGMICSEIELEIGEDASGIIVLDGDYELGTPAGAILVDSDEVFDVEITPNRSDLLSHVGVAREVSALYKTPVKTPAAAVADSDAKPDFKIDIESADDCPRYVGRRVNGIRVGPSPRWLVQSLEAVGIQSINNIVDVANYVMMEMGQPLHAFDFAKIGGREIKIRRAVAGEKLLALDDKTYELNPGILVIADENVPVALAGIMGGEESAVHDDTTDILIESANFHATVVRKGRKSLAMSTEASYRFERGVDRELCRLAADRAAELICEVAGGQVAAVIDSHPKPHETKSITIREHHTRRILGATLSIEEITALLERLNFAVRERADESTTVDVPSYRMDMFEEIDLIEEVARLHGYERIGTGWSFRCTTFATRDPYDRFVEDLADYLAARGFDELLGSAFTDGRELADFGWEESDPRSRPIPIRNPLNANHRFMRTSLLPGMLDIVKRNIDQGARRLKFFQAGRVYIAPEGVTQLPEERIILTLVLSRPDGTEFWKDSNSSLDLFDIKEEIEGIFRAFKVDPGSDLCYDFDRSTGRFNWSKKDEILVEGGVVSDVVAERYDFEQPIWHATIDLSDCYELRSKHGKLKPLAEYPVSKRDLSLVTSAGVEYGEIEKALAKHGGRLLESCVVFDVYRGEKIAKEHTAYGVRLSFRAPDRTLRDEEIDRVIDKIVARLKNELGVELRS